MLINHLSVSRVGVWDECKQKYKFQYHLKYPPEEKEPFYFIYGKIIHKIAEEYVGCKGEKLISEVTADVLTGKIEVERGKKAPKLLAEYKARMPEHLRAIKFLTDIIGYEGEREYPFRFDLDPPNGRLAIGFMDRLIIKDGKCWIIDYKTTKKGLWRKTSVNITGDLQLRCYARIAQKQFGIKPENIQAALYYLEGAELIGARFSEESLDSVERELLTVYKAIENANPDTVVGNVGSHCRRCSYRKICPFYSSN